MRLHLVREVQTACNSFQQCVTDLSTDGVIAQIRLTRNVGSFHGRLRAKAKFLGSIAQQSSKASCRKAGKN
jgi:hypothetical protein